MNFTYFWTYYFILINIGTFHLYRDDKRRAKKGKWRISENKLLLVTMIGGSIGALVAMKVFRHKTQHWKFKILVPVFLILHMVALYILL